MLWWGREVLLLQESAEFSGIEAQRPQDPKARLLLRGFVEVEDAPCFAAAGLGDNDYQGWIADPEQCP